MAGITPAQFRALMSPEDIADIETGAIHTKILCAYASPSPRDPLGTGGPGGDAMTTAALARNRS